MLGIKIRLAGVIRGTELGFKTVSPIKLGLPKKLKIYTRVVVFIFQCSGTDSYDMHQAAGAKSTLRESMFDLETEQQVIITSKLNSDNTSARILSS